MGGVGGEEEGGVEGGVGRGLEFEEVGGGGRLVSAAMVEASVGGGSVGFIREGRKEKETGKPRGDEAAGMARRRTVAGSQSLPYNPG